MQKKARYANTYLKILFCVCALAIFVAALAWFAAPSALPTKAAGEALTDPNSPVTLTITAPSVVYDGFEKPLQYAVNLPSGYQLDADRPTSVHYQAAGASDKTDTPPMFAGDYVVTVTTYLLHNGAPTSASFEGSFAITKRPVELEFSEDIRFYYTGAAQMRGFNIINRANTTDVIVPTITYLHKATEVITASPTAVGEYRFHRVYLETQVDTHNDNYSLTYFDNGYDGLEIKKAILSVTLNPLTITTDETPVFTYTYSGFVGEDTKAVLTTLPSVSNVPTTAGTYTLTPSGASAENYEIFYYPGKLVVNKTSLLGESLGENNKTHHLSVKGNFSSDTKFSASLLIKEDNAFSFAKEKLSTQSEILFGSDIEYMFHYKIDGKVDSSFIQIKIDNVKPSSLFSKKVGIVDKNGNFYKIDSFRLSNGELSLTTIVTEGTVVVYRDSVLTYAIIVGVLFLVFLVVALKIGSNISYKKLKRSLKQPPATQEAPTQKGEKW